jgi:integrase/recombinase XerD
LDEVGFPVVPVMKYLKYLDQTGKSNNTLKTYCYALKQYFIYLEERKIDYKEVGVKDLADFVGWLRNPFESGKVGAYQWKARCEICLITIEERVNFNSMATLWRKQGNAL